MRCEYKDGLKIDYSGSLRMKKGNEIGGYFARKDSIPADIRYELDKSVRKNSCSDIRKIAEIVTHDVCGRICMKT
jgi:hypothetical protein